MLSLIFAELRDLPHVIALAITCRYLLGVGKAEVLRATHAYHAPWAGCRLICFGTDMQPADLPERMLSEREREVMRDWLAAWRLASREREGDEDGKHNIHTNPLYVPNSKMAMSYYGDGAYDFNPVGSGEWDMQRGEMRTNDRRYAADSWGAGEQERVVGVLE